MLRRYVSFVAWILMATLSWFEWSRRNRSRIYRGPWRPPRRPTWYD